MNHKDKIICRCEEVTYTELVNTFNAYQCSARELKLRTRAGMGVCGGRTCRSLIENIATVADHKEINKYKQVPLKHQPPVRPIYFNTKEEQ